MTKRAIEPISTAKGSTCSMISGTRSAETAISPNRLSGASSRRVAHQFEHVDEVDEHAGAEEEADDPLQEDPAEIAREGGAASCRPPRDEPGEGGGHPLQRAGDDGRHEGLDTGEHRTADQQQDDDRQGDGERCQRVVGGGEAADAEAGELISAAEPRPPSTARARPVRVVRGKPMNRNSAAIIAAVEGGCEPAEDLRRDPPPRPSAAGSSGESDRSSPTVRSLSW